MLILNVLNNLYSNSIFVPSGSVNRTSVKRPLQLTAIRFIIMPRRRREGAISVAFVRTSVRSPSVCPSVAYIVNNSRNQGSSVPKFGRNVPHLSRDSHFSFKVKRSKVRVTRPINADTHRAPYLPNAKAYELQTWYTDGGRRPASAIGIMTSKVKGQGHKLTSSVCLISVSS